VGDLLTLSCGVVVQVAVKVLLYIARGTVEGIVRERSSGATKEDPRL